ncbi:MAG: efflux RND transporter periplasmic adaptor subunit [Oscillospiraceae bacterium]
MKSKLQRILAFCTAGALAGALLTGCVFLPDEEEVIAPPTVKASEVKYSTVKVEKKDFIKQVTNSGTVTSVHSYDMAFEEQSGVIAKIYVRPGDKVKKGDIICKLDTYDLDYSISEKELYVKRAKLTKTVLEQQKASQAEIDKAQVDVEILQNELDTLTAQKDAASLYATKSGTVASLGDFSAGDNINVGTVVATIIDTANLYIALKPSDTTVYKIGQAVQIRIDETYYDGEVFMTPKDLLAMTDDEKKDADIAYESEYVYVKFTGKAPSAAVGILADVVLVLQQKDDVIVIAKNLIKTVNDQKVVYLLKDGAKIEQPITVGLETGSVAEITAGLSEGDEIIIR